MDDSFGIRRGRNELPQPSANPAGPGLQSDDSFGLQPARGELPQASANLAALTGGDPTEAGKDAAGC
eukprot:4803183-Alexandrium_andersonii.AAC.1